MVETARVELASENRSAQLSTSVVYLLAFPPPSADKQAHGFGISEYIRGAGELPGNVHH